MKHEWRRSNIRYPRGFYYDIIYYSNMEYEYTILLVYTTAMENCLLRYICHRFHNLTERHHARICNKPHLFHIFFMTWTTRYFPVPHVSIQGILTRSITFIVIQERNTRLNGFYTSASTCAGRAYCFSDDYVRFTVDTCLTQMLK